ncbi:NAD(P)-binding protein [Didymella exigua CBS 183.55]|uniref:NAD(P)-binding protein n=1 Tax=Didymella exigua CBS 183.55 TaxID=1150837 RepID=A0A6A5RSW5_9PLEO|nr:NAD(P)-binding protein [Didymella exigua CBS 183.55]KAF1931551.1 NAD(P)-binding protein [Didymella exigua CBS 183.55]
MSDQKRYSNKLQGSRVLIIGGSSGIGFCIAEACLEYGALVTIASSNPSKITAAIFKLQSSYPSAKSSIHGQTVDLSKSDTLESELETLFEQTVKGMGSDKLDHVIFTAGDALATTKLADVTMKSILKAGQVRFFAPLLAAKFIPQYVKNSHESSYTITTGSISERPMPDWSVIASYAGGHHSMVRNLALDMKPIRVNGVSPGVVDTELWKMSQEEKDKLMGQMSKKMATGTPGRPEWVAESFLGIMRDYNIDGAMIRTDGGGLFM